MAQSTVAVLQSSSPFTRSDSLASSASGASLTRRSRTRTRTLSQAKRGKNFGPSGKQRDEDGPVSVPLADVAPPVPPLCYDSPEEVDISRQMRPSDSNPSSRAAPSHEHPTVTVDKFKPDSRRISRSWSAVNVREGPGQTRGRQAKSEGGSLRGVKAVKRGISLPRQAFRSNVSSDSSSQPSPLTPHNFHDMPGVHVVGDIRGNYRDSTITQFSSTSSSLYPASTSTGSSLLPYSDDQDESMDTYPQIASPGNSEFDADDVSYRLRLLLNNSYFLPPAHTKPSPLSLAPPPILPAKRATKPANANFLDFFRIGKSKSKPVTPLTCSPPAVDVVAAAPILRTTSDSPSASGFAPRAPTCSLNPPQSAANRVVVLRERMDDLATAAREAERELRTRSDVRRAIPRDDPLEVIDPTDAVDLPPSYADSLFAVQASAAYGLGIRDSLGAAVLAERLPPPNSPPWSLNVEEDSWRKALLHEAVSHSLTSTPAASFSSSASDPLLSPPAPASELLESVEEPPTEVPVSMHRQTIGQRIVEELKIETPIMGHDDPTETQGIAMNRNSIMSGMSKSPHALEHPAWGTSAGPPARAETPAPTHPLAPAPRRHLTNPLFSQSQPDLPDLSVREAGHIQSPGSSPSFSQVVRKAVSSPKLCAAYPAGRGGQVMLSLSPPPMSIHQRSSRTVTEDMLPMSSFPSSRSVTTQSRYSDDGLSYATPMETDSEQQVPRPSVSVSLSEYSAASPTASAFHDALFGSAYRPPSSLSRRSYVPSIAPMQQPEIAVSPPICLSPPPRVSSTVLPTVLPPPPRSPARKPICRPSTSSCASHTSPEPGRRSRASTAPSFTSESAQYDTVHTSNTPPVPLLPLAERRGQGPSLSLQIPSDSVSPSLHSAPAPASPDFFDRIQSHPNAMDDLETSDESDDEENAREETATVFVEPRTQAVSNRASSSSSRPSIMRLGNHSTPQLTPSPSFAITEPLPRFELDRKKPIGNIPLRNNFFAARKKGMKGNTNTPLLPIGPTSSSSVHAFGIGEAGTSSHPAQRKRPATATEAEDRVRRWQRESLQKFDGMLVQHLAAERDTIKRITSNISNSKS